MVVMTASSADTLILRQLNAIPVTTLIEQLQRKIFSNFYKLCSIDTCLNKSIRVFKNQISIENMLEAIVSLQKIFVSAYDELDEAKKRSLKEMFSIERKKIEDVLNQLSIENEEERVLRDNVIENITLLGKQIIVATSFDDQRVCKAVDFIKKGGVNPGYTMTNQEGTKFTIKQGNTVGHTLSEAFSSMVLNEIVKSFGVANPSLKLIANAFLIVKELGENDKSASIETRCNMALFAASQWSSDRASFEACQLFGLKKRIKAAGTRQVEDFKDLRELNAACDLGLETIIMPSALIVDFDLHTENFMLKINDEAVKNMHHKEQIKVHIELLQREMSKSNGVTREARITYLKGIITTLKDLGARVFFHKIDHDNGFYRYVDPARKVDFLTHRTSPIHRVGTLFKSQPTLHITELTGGTKEGMDQLLLSDKGIDKLLKINFEVQLAIMSKVSDEFFKILREKSIAIAGKDNKKQCNAAEFYLLNEFYHHIKEKRMPMPSDVSDDDIYILRSTILTQLELGAKLKVSDLHEQVYNRLLEKDKTGTLSAKQIELKTFLEEQCCPTFKQHQEFGL